MLPPESNFIQVPSSNCVVVPIHIFMKLVESHLKKTGEMSSPEEPVDPALEAEAQKVIERINNNAFEAQLR